MVVMASTLGFKPLQGPVVIGNAFCSQDDKESEDDYDEDGEFMVPHGYLSADEEDEDPEVSSISL